MNPYDFVPLDMGHKPQRRKPIWHSVLTRGGNQKLYSGHLHVYIAAETPLFIRDADTSVQNPKSPGTHIRNKSNEYIIPGTSIKGMLRNVVETLCGGCMTVFRMPREYTRNPIPQDFDRCTNNTLLCTSCRIFGMIGQRKPGQHEIDVFLGKVNISDAYAYEDTLDFYHSIYTAVLDTPKPRHRAFYLDNDGRFIAGRKYYFHHADPPRTENRLLEIRNRPGEYRNQYIKPLDKDTEFSARIDFTNLEADEFAALLLAITLQPDMRHKIGYGKPIGLGSIQLTPTALKLVDYKTRYTAFRSGAGITHYNINEISDLLDKQLASFDAEVHTAFHNFRSRPSLQHLHRIWQWPPDDSAVYSYPSQRWFKDNPRAHIADTIDLYPGD